MGSQLTVESRRLDQRFTPDSTSLDGNLTLSISSSGESFLVNVSDLSKGGFCFRSPLRLPIKEGSTISVSRNNATSNQASARLVWSDLDTGNMHRGGVAFVVNQEPSLRNELLRGLSSQYDYFVALESKLGNQVCRRCLLSDRVKNTSFDQNGICNYCNEFNRRESTKYAQLDYEVLNKKLLSQLKDRNPRARYDCLCLYSGGKDSTYMLYQLVHTYKLRVLAFTFDNYFIAPETYSNMRKVLAKLDVDHILFKPSWKHNKVIFKTGMNESAKMPASEELAYMIGHACWPCFTQIAMHSIKLAIDKGIKSVVVGTTPGQIRQKKYNMTAKYNGLVDVYKSMITPMLKLLSLTGNDSERRALDLSIIDQIRALSMKLVPFYEFCKYDESLVLKTVKSELGWESPKSTDSCSTNCQLNSLGIKVHQNKYGISPYLIPLSRDIREGSVSRSEALVAVTGELNSDIVQSIAKKFEVAI